MAPVCQAGTDSAPFSMVSIVVTVRYHPFDSDSSETVTILPSASGHLRQWNRDAGRHFSVSHD